MKKNNFTLIVFIMLGILAGLILSELLSSVPALAFLTKSAQITWQPKADLNVIKYDMNIQVKLNIATIIGVAAACWIYRKI